MKYRVNKAWNRKQGVFCDTIDEAYNLAADHLRANKDDIMEVWEIQGAVKRFFGVLTYPGIYYKDTWYQDMKNEKKPNEDRPKNAPFQYENKYTEEWWR